MPRTMQQIIVRNSAMTVGSTKEMELEMETTAVISLEARPVAVMQPAMMPAMEHATATVMVPLPPASSASNIFLNEMRSSPLRSPTTTQAIMETDAANCIVRAPLTTSHTRIISGRSR